MTRPLHNYRRIKGTKLQAPLSLMLKIHEEFKSCFFWTSPTTASARRQMENKNTHQIRFQHRGIYYEVSTSVICTCTRVSEYLTVSIQTPDGNTRRGNVRTIKRLLGIK